MLKHSETKHKVDEDRHDECLELADELLDCLKNEKYPEHIVELVEGIAGELKEYEDEEEVGEDDKELEKRHYEEMGKEEK